MVINKILIRKVLITEQNMQKCSLKIVLINNLLGRWAPIISSFHWIEKSSTLRTLLYIMIINKLYFLKSLFIFSFKLIYYKTNEFHIYNWQLINFKPINLLRVIGAWYWKKCRWIFRQKTPKNAWNKIRYFSLVNFKLKYKNEGDFIMG